MLFGFKNEKPNKMIEFCFICENKLNMVNSLFILFKINIKSGGKRTDDFFLEMKTHSWLTTKGLKKGEIKDLKDIF